MWETLRDTYQREIKNLHDTKSGQAAGTTHESKWQCLMPMSFVKKTVMIPQPTLSNVRAAEELVIGITLNLEDDNASTNVSINDNDNDEFSEGVYDECQAKKNLGTKRKIKFQKEALYLEKKIKLMEERLMKSPKPMKTTCA